MGIEEWGLEASSIEMSRVRENEVAAIIFDISANTSQNSSLSLRTSIPFPHHTQTPPFSPSYPSLPAYMSLPHHQTLLPSPFPNVQSLYVVAAVQVNLALLAPNKTRY